MLKDGIYNIFNGVAEHRSLRNQKHPFTSIVGQAFGGHEVGLRMDHEHSTLDVYFCNQKVLKLNSSHKRKY